MREIKRRKKKIWDVQNWMCIFFYHHRFRDTWLLGGALNGNTEKGIHCYVLLMIDIFYFGFFFLLFWQSTYDRSPVKWLTLLPTLNNTINFENLSLRWLLPLDAFWTVNDTNKIIITYIFSCQKYTFMPATTKFCIHEEFNNSIINWKKRDEWNVRY